MLWFVLVIIQYVGFPEWQYIPFPEWLDLVLHNTTDISSFLARIGLCRYSKRKSFSFTSFKRSFPYSDDISDSSSTSLRSRIHCSRIRGKPWMSIQYLDLWRDGRVVNSNGRIFSIRPLDIFVSSWLISRMATFIGWISPET
jgi:hypothetical protein